jgi:hypothetical protein
MPSNRDYTGLERTPSSMAWLIGKRARIKGQLDRLKRIQSALPDQIAELEGELMALDAVIPLHEVRVDPKVIKGCAPKGPTIAAHGELTRFLLRVLREARGEPLYTAEIAMRFAREHQIQFDQMPSAELMDRIGKRLGVLVQKGLVRRHHKLRTRGPGLWSLMEWEGADRGESDDP